jgi:hypothetical protein
MAVTFFYLKDNDVISSSTLSYFKRIISFKKCHFDLDA